jgi:hypothetical protein
MAPSKTQKLPFVSMVNKDIENMISQIKILKDKKIP